jgi:TatD DNase family protein
MTAMPTASPAFVDSHCHLDYAGMAEDRAGILARARARGVSAMLNISTREDEWDAVIATAEQEPDVWATVGIHPHEADSHPHVDAATLIARAAHPRVAGLGETGLDFHYDHSDRDRQRASFRAHIDAARATGLPLVIHSRDADTETADMLEAAKAEGDFPALIHCFTGGAEFAARVLDLGLSISISGIVTFKNAAELRAIAANVPADRLLIETDSPFLAPVPHRGSRCEPAFVADTAAFLADLRGETIEALAEQTRMNFHRLFARTAPAAAAAADA